MCEGFFFIDKPGHISELASSHN